MEEVTKPTCIVDHNKYMSGVDGLDQMISYYPITRKTLKWTTKVFCAQRFRSVPCAEQNEEVQTLVPIRSATRKAVGAQGGG